ncbi:MAG: hypothetical protein K0Q49_2090 [Haloplasmataceae bacterium]|jgi:uncharacterized membrane protein|nr:hypothetical protein [Haloplasmataceae bacterium]
MNSNKIRSATKGQQAIWETLMHIGRKCGCHQFQSRSFFYRNFQFPICARCTGIIIGEFILAPISLLFSYNNIIFNIMLLSIMVTDGLLQYFKILESNNIRRLITGLMGGYAFMLLTISVTLMLWRFLKMSIMF